MESCTVHLAQLLARTIEKMMTAECHTPVRLSDDCIRVLAETIAAVEAGRVQVGDRARPPMLEQKRDCALVPA